mmetsp:Transcript_36851/g.83100  ORF Transcript_36851/g.83100 Transcript_36851/m.83100 type:complete len:333 (+) Transcript_36851:849-1847(+)
MEQKHLVIIAAGKHLFPRGTEDESVLVLSCVAPLDVDQRGISLNKANVAEILEPQEVLSASQAIQVAAAEGEGAKVAIDNPEKLLGLGHPQGDVASVEVLHVVTALEVLMHDSLAGRAERLDRVELALLHLGRVASLDNGHALARMDLVRVDRVTVEVPDRLHGVDLSVDLNLVGLHDFLDSLADIAQSHVDACLLDAGIGRLLDRLGQRVVAGVEVVGESAVDDPPVDVSAEVELDNVVVLQHGLVSSVGCPVSRHMVDAATSGEGDAALGELVLDELSHFVLQLLAEIDHELSWLGDRLEVLARRPVNFRPLARFLVDVALQPLLLLQLC